MGKTEDKRQQKETSMVLDLSDFVTVVDRFSRLIEPFALVFYTIDDIRRWRFRKSTIILWLVCNVACLWLTQGAVFVLASGLVIAIATLSLFQVHTQILSKLLPSYNQPSKVTGEEEEDSTLTTVQNFRYSLIEMHDFLVKCNEYLCYFYSVLRWDAVGPSAIYHIQVCVFLLSMVMCPARWNCFLVINWFFFCHPHIIRRGCRYIKEHWLSVRHASPADEKSAFGQKEQTSDNKDEKDEDNCEDDDSSDLDPTEKIGDSSMFELDPSPSKPGMVARLMEIKKRRKQIASAPAALKETVLVCCSCHALLVSQGDVASDAQGQGPG